MSDDDLWWREDRYRAIFSHAADSKILQGIWRDAYGDDYPAEVEPFGFTPLSDLEHIAAAFRPPIGRLVDIGCGKGGPGLWVARRLGASLLGIDLLEEAVAQAETFSRRFADCPPAEFRVGSFTETGLPSGAADAVMSIDCFWMVIDKPAALRETARILRPSGQFIFTTWTPPHIDLRALLDEAGLRILEFGEAEAWWLKPHLRVYEEISVKETSLRHEIGDDATDILIYEALTASGALHKNQRVLVIAEKA